MAKKSITQRVNELLGTNYKGLIERVQWVDISTNQKLSEDFIREFKDYVDWYCISRSQKLSNEFIEEFKDYVYWGNISMYQKLSENFIRKFKDCVNWCCISSNQKLSEDFIREFKDYVDWFYISINQKLSESFIHEFKGKVYWHYISGNQKLSESFIREFKDKVDWDCISECQKLSNEFIEEFKDKLNIYAIKDSWHYKTTEKKKQAVITTGLYECHEDHFIAYKGIRSDRYSKYNFQYKYEKGGIYESWCDTSNDGNSFGLSVWDEANAREYCSELIVKVKVNYEDVGRVVHNGGKIRCFKIEILD